MADRGNPLHTEIWLLFRVLPGVLPLVLSPVFCAFAKSLLLLVLLSVLVNMGSQAAVKVCAAGS